ncbi:AimR family lysis-lysogeny pheromone receptor [Bacillus pumilus]|nr:AimR family lysis-lysogeny pheromone receptor [Bacillus pumilus]
MNIKLYIKNKCEDDSSLAMKLAKIAGYSDRTGLYKFLNSSNKEMDDLNNLINLVREIDQDREIELISDYITTLDPNKSAARQAVEYLDANQLNDETDEMVYKLCNASNSISKEWGNVYRIHRMLTKDEIDLTSAIKETGKIKIKSDEMFVFSSMMSLYEYLNTGEFGLMKSTSAYIDLSKLKNGYIKESFRSRFLLLMANVFLNDNNLKALRDYCNQIITEDIKVNRFQVFAHLTCGNSYVFENYEKAKAYYINGLKFAKNKFHEYKLRSALAFLENSWGVKDNKYLEQDPTNDSDLIELAHHYLLNNRIDDMMDVFNKLDSTVMNDNDLGFLYYVKGVFYKDKGCYLKSVKHFKKSDDKYFIKLPLIKLEKLGIEIEILDLLAI